MPITHQSMAVYQYVYRCDCRYVGRTSLRLQDRINQHIPKSVRNKENPIKVLPKRNCKITTPLNQLDCDSAIGLHLIQNPGCASHYHIDQFFILAKASTIFHLGTLEATFIKMLKPTLCRQKEFVYSLQILRQLDSKIHPYSTDHKRPSTTNYSSFLFSPFLLQIFQ